MNLSNFRDWLGVDETELQPLILECFLEFHRRWRKELLEAASPILLGKGQRDFKLQFPGRHVDKALEKPEGEAGGGRVIQGPDDNYLIPYQSLKTIMGKKTTPGAPIGSAFLRDQPYIGAYSQANPINMASTIIFVLMTIRAGFMAVMQDFPVLMMMLMGKFQEAPVSGQDLETSIAGMEKGLLSKSNPATKAVSKTDKNREFRTGYSIGTTFFGTKYKAVANVWNDRDKHYNNIMEAVSKKDTVAVFEYLLQNISGLAQAKAGFVVQLVFGELGCIDMHNVNLYSQFYLDREGQSRGRGSFRPDHFPKDSPLTMRNPLKRDKEMYAALDPNFFSAKPPAVPLQPGPTATSRTINTFRNRRAKFKGAVKRYIDVLEGLESDGFNTIKLWDIWVAYVSRAYVKSGGGSRYARDGMMSGNPLDPANDPTDAKIMGVHGPIPDRNTLVTSRDSQLGWKDGSAYKISKTTGDLGRPVDTYTVSGMDKEMSAGSASGAHGATWWWRMPEYWWDQINLARGQRAKDGFRYASSDNSGPSTVISKPLAYIASDPQLLRSVFPDDAERKRFQAELTDVMKMWNFWKNPDSIVSKWKKR